MSNSDKLASKLKEIVGEANVMTDPEQLKALAVDGLTAKVMVSPGTMEETSKVVAWACAEKLAVIPMGGGTKMGQGGIPKKVDILLSTKRMNRYNDYDIANLTVGVEAGLTLAEVQAKLAGEGRGYFIPLDPQHSQSATVGGIVATNDSGSRRFLYGGQRDFILGIKAVMPNGDIMSVGGKAVKNVAGYDMTKLMIGSMGAIGIICEITFRITPRPDAQATLLFPFSSLAQAAGFLKKLLHSKYYPACLELINAKMAADLKETSALKANYVAAVALDGIEEWVVRLKKDLSEMGKQEGASGAAVLTADAHQDFWVAYRDVADSLAKTQSSLVALKANFALAKVPEMVGAFESALKESGFEADLFCSAGNGVLRGVFPLGADKGAQAAALIGRLTAEAVKNGGNLIVEQAPTAVKEKVSVWGQTRSDAVVVRRIKEQLDPAGIMNPGRYVAGV
jgi:glycolate oxidase FAD binding subunit